MQRILEKSVIAGLFLIPFIPFVVTGSMFFPFITGKAFVFRGIVGVVFALWCVLLIYDTSYIPKKNPILFAVLGFFGVVALADIFGVHFVRSLWSNFERMEGLVTFLYLCAFFVVSSTVLARTNTWKAFWNTSIVVSCMVGIYALFQVMGSVAVSQGGVRVDATLGNSIYLAVYMLFHIFLTLWFLYTRRSSRTRIVLYTLALVLQFAALFYTGTRGTMLGLLGGLGLTALLIVWRGKEHLRLRKLSLGFIVCILLLVGVFVAVRKSSFVQGSEMLKRFANVSFVDGTVQSRLVLWSGIAKDGFLERPILGWGQDNFIVVFGKYYDPRMYQQEPWFDRAHNVFFDWLISAGILGLLAYLSLFVVTLITLWHPTTALSVTERALFTGLLSGYFVHNIFVFDNLISYIFFFSFIGFIESFSLMRQNVSVKEKDVYGNVLIQDSSVRTSVSLATAGILLFLVYITTVPHIVASQSLIKGLTYIGNGADPMEALPLFERALQDPIGRDEARLQLSRAAFTLAQSTVSQDIKQTYLSRAYEEAKKATQEDPDNTRPKYFLAIFEARLGNLDQVIRLFEELLMVNPDRQMFLSEYGTALQLKGESERAQDVFRKLVTLAPEDQEYKVRYIVSLLNLKKVSDALLFVRETFGATTEKFVSEEYYRGKITSYSDALQGISFQILRGELLKNENIDEYLSKINELTKAKRVDDALQLVTDAARINAEFAKGVPALREAIQSGKEFQVQTTRAQ
jgi:O-antigen ligase/tetratricopeptide (TPR) repeat protein